MPEEEEMEGGFRLGDWEVLPSRRVLRCGDREEEPEPKVFDFLLALARRDGDLASKEDLIKECWDGRAVSDDVITQKATQLRSILGDDARNPKYLKTVPRKGYRLIKKVELLGDQVAAIAPPAAPQANLKQERLWLGAAVVVIAVLISAIWFLYPLKVKSIGVLPFQIMSGDPGDQYLAAGFQAELVHTLHNIPKLSVIPVKKPYPDREVSEIADTLGVDTVLYGEMQRVGKTLKVIYAVARRGDGKIISAGDVSGQEEQLFDLQGKLAVQVRNDLIGESPQQLISANRTPNSEAFDRYIRGLDALERRGRGRPTNLDAAITLFSEAIELDPDFGPSYLSLATAYALLPDYQNAPLEEFHNKALQQLERGIAIDSSLADAAGGVEGFVYHKRREWSKAEAAYLRATNANMVDSNAFNWYSLMLSGVGRLNDALEQVLIAQKIDPGSTVINARLGMVYTWLGESEKAADFFDRASLLDASEEIHMLGRTLLLVREGRMDEAASAFGTGVSMAGHEADWIGPVFAAINDPTKTAAALAAVDAAFSDPRMDPRFNVIVRAVLGDTDGAMQVALGLADSGAFFEMDFLFMPELRSLRQHDGFLTLMEKLGVQRYWVESDCRWRNDRVSC